MPDLDARLAAALADRYRLERELGQGGMAIVYLAEDLRHHRKVAVKVLRPELAAALGGERFLREIQIAANLRHPHILPLYDSGAADGFLYYVMPLVEGESLRDRLTREKQLPIDDAVRYAREVADALSYAHAHGVVHRDIKPENILIESDNAVVADFGIAKAVAAAGPRTTLTDPGIAIGTPAYMSPEQAAGDKDLDGRSDLYSLGCVLYEMFAGHPPFRGATTESLARQHVMSLPQPVTQFRPAVPALVNDALMRALAKAPADRFNPVGQFSAALGHVTTTTFASPPPARRRMRWMAAVAITLLLASGAVWTFNRRDGAAATDPSAARSIAVLPFDNLSGDSSIVPLILGIHAEIVTQLTKLGELAVTSRSSTLEYRNSTKTERTIASELGVGSLLTGEVQRSGDQVHVSVALADASRGKQLWADSYDRPYTVANLFEIQGDIARQVATALRVQLSDEQQQQIARAPTTNVAALDAYYRGLARWDDLRLTFDTLAIGDLEEAVALDPSFVAAWSRLAQARAWLVSGFVTHDTLPAWVAVQRTHSLAPGSLEAVLASGYYLYYARGDLAGALNKLSDAHRLMPNSSEILTAMALLRRRGGRWDDAVTLLVRAQQIDPRNVNLLIELGSTYLSMRRFDEAERILNQALAIQPQNVTLILRKYQLLESTGDTARARALARAIPGSTPASIKGYFARAALFARDYPAALAGAGQLRASFNRSLWHRSLALAMVAAASGDSALARRHADTLLRNGRSELAEHWPEGTLDPFGGRTNVENQMAVALALRGQREAAVRLAEAADRRYGIAQDAVAGASTSYNLAITYTLVGRRADAVAMLERLLAIPSTVTVPRLRLEPWWDGLRGEAAFQRLIATTH
ncbi:MAG TPA: protein kinase [Gemmatimonadaceae bacterium]|nr:protein kinase [Gemmatimonadaceae bacterium]